MIALTSSRSDSTSLAFTLPLNSRTYAVGLLLSMVVLDSSTLSFTSEEHAVRMISS